jgi:heme-binding protein
MFANRKEFFMTSTPRTAARALRRSLCAAFAATAVGGAAVAALGVPSATAAQDPCAASEVAKTVGSVVTSTGNYLDGHPETNQALTTISQQQAGPQSLAAMKAYFDANPQIGKDMQALQSPLTVLSTRCKLPVTLPQLMGLMQAAQQQGGALPGGLPGGLPAAQTVGAPAAGVPAQPSPASAGVPGTGPLPSSVTAGVR